MRQLRPPSLLEELGLSGPQRAAPGSWPTTSPRAARCRPCRRPWTRRPRRPSCSTGVSPRRGTRLAARAGPPVPGGQQRAAARLRREPGGGHRHRRRAARADLRRDGRERRDAPALRVRAAGGAGAGDGGAGRRAPRDGSADAARGPVAPGRDQARGEGPAAHRTAAGPHCAIDVQADDRGRNATAVAWKRQPLEGGGATHPGVHGLRTHSVGWGAPA